MGTSDKAKAEMGTANKAEDVGPKESVVPMAGGYYKRLYLYFFCLYIFDDCASLKA